VIRKKAGHPTDSAMRPPGATRMSRLAAIKLDPLAVAPYVDAERVFMILTRTDAIIPFEAQEQLRETMGSPESLYLMTGHRPSVVYFPKVRNAAFEFFVRRFERDEIAFAVN